RGPPRIGQHARGARDFLVDAMLRFDFAGLMMDHRIELALFLTRTAGKNQQRHSFRKRARNRINHVVAAGAVGYEDHPDFAGRPRVTVRGEPDSGLVGERENLQSVLSSEDKKQLECQIAGDSEQMAYAELADVSCDELSQPHPPFHVWPLPRQL